MLNMEYISRWVSVAVSEKPIFFSFICFNNDVDELVSCNKTLNLHSYFLFL